MEHYIPKAEYLYIKQKGRCAITGKSLTGGPYYWDLHHAGIHNSKVNRKLYPLFIDSVWNLMLADHEAHLNCPLWGRISYIEADHRERFLRRHPMIAQAMNLGGCNEKDNDF